MEPIHSVYEAMSIIEQAQALFGNIHNGVGAGMTDSEMRRRSRDLGRVRSWLEALPQVTITVPVVTAKINDPAMIVRQES